MSASPHDSAESDLLGSGGERGRRPREAGGNSAGGEGGEAGGNSAGGEGGERGGGIAGTRYGRYMGVLAAVALLGVLANALLSSPGNVRGIAPGRRIPPFAAPLALGSLSGDVNVATRTHQGQAGSRPACGVRGAQILNVCQLYERAPLVLALFVDADSCTRVLHDMQTLVAKFPDVRFAAVAIKGETDAVRRLVRLNRLDFPVGLDRDGILVQLYGLASCPQVNFVYPGGEVQAPALLGARPAAELRTRVAALLSASRARGWSAPR